MSMLQFPHFHPENLSLSLTEHDGVWSDEGHIRIAFFFEAESWLRNGTIKGPDRFEDLPKNWFCA